MEHQERLQFSEGHLTVLFEAFTPAATNPELPDQEYIIIRYLTAEPRGRRLLKQHVSAVIDLIRSRLGPDRKIIFQPANGRIGDDAAQARIEAYYRDCGFVVLPTSESGWWMTWPS